MRELYNRKPRPEYWIDIIHYDLDLKDSVDVNICEMMQENDQSILTIIRYITAILRLKKQLEKPYSVVTKNHVQVMFRWMEGKQYKVKTHEKYRAVLKKFYEMIYGNYEVYPDCIYYVFGTVRKGYKN